MRNEVVKKEAVRKENAERQLDAYRSDMDRRSEALLECCRSSRTPSDAKPSVATSNVKQLTWNFFEETTKNYLKEQNAKENAERQLDAHRSDMDRRAETLHECCRNSRTPSD
jgi:hypothetical protein